MKDTYEIECKAWIDNPEEIRKKLREKYTFTGEYTKNDTYYHFPGGQETFRVREQPSTTIVTMKKKKREKGIEKNLEIEFSVSNAENFLRFIQEFHCPVYVRKVKKSEVFTAGELTVELSRVETLGWFVEIEKLVSSAEEEAQSAAEAEVRSVLRDLGVPEEKLEERYYTELLTGIAEGGK
jgi:predicted adenylyl cyclase CyaB